MTNETKVNTPVRVDFHGAYAFMHDAEGVPLVEFLTGHDEKDATCEFIVKAVNNHDALVAMVEELKMLVRVTGPLTTARERADKLLNRLK